jgi:hypothetical protein
MEALTPARRPLAGHPAWALLIVAAPVLAALHAGPLFIDDAYITFRYAANLARGHGMVYNATPVLGTTAPLYCLILALLRLLGAPITAAAAAIGVTSAAATPVVLWRTGIAARRPGAGLLAALLLALFPPWWIHSVSGMETTLAALLVAATIHLDLTRRPIAAGITAALLVLTRPDAALLPPVIFGLRLLHDRRAALRFGVASAFALLPWLVFATVYFGSPAPHSLAAKQMIHAFPFVAGLGRYFGWFIAIKEPAAMAAMSALWIAGAARIVRRERALLPVLVWPVIFLIGLAATRIGRFFWYPVPALPLYFLVAAVGAGVLFSVSRPTRAVAAALLAVFLAAQFHQAWPELSDRAKLSARVEKEAILAEQSRLIAARVHESGRDPATVKVYAGEVGVVGYRLLDAEIIDSAGINSPEVLAIRRADWDRLRAANPGLTYRAQWAGSPDWSREIIDRFAPDFIISNAAYLHLITLADEPAFARLYRLLDARPDSLGNTFVVYERNRS